MKVCVYTCMRDEADNVAAWAETTLDADIRFVLDTGSSDRTVAELAANGVPTESATFEPFRFDDARNCALALAPSADLYLRLDADERLPEDWREQLEAVYHPNIARYRYRVRNTDGIWATITRDDLHRRGGFRWRYPTHEILVGPPAACDMPRLVVTHTSPPERRPHHLANLDVLYAAVAEYPNDHRMLFYLGRECWYAGRWDQVRQWLVRFLDLPGGWPPERAEAYRILAAVDYEPERWLWKAIGECPERREPWVDLARLYLGAGRVQEAGMAMFSATQRDDDTLYTTDPRAWGMAFHELEDEIGAQLAQTLP